MVIYDINNVNISGFICRLSSVQTGSKHSILRVLQISVKGNRIKSDEIYNSSLRNSTSQVTMTDHLSSVSFCIFTKLLSFPKKKCKKHFLNTNPEYG